MLPDRCIALPAPTSILGLFQHVLATGLLYLVVAVRLRIPMVLNNALSIHLELDILLPFCDYVVFFLVLFILSVALTLFNNCRIGAGCLYIIFIYFNFCVLYFMFYFIYYSLNFVCHFECQFWIIASYKLNKWILA